MKLQRKVKHNEKMYLAHELGSYAQGQGRNQVKANLMKLHRKIKHNENVCSAHELGSYAQGQGRNQVKGQNRVSAISQKLLKQI